MLKLHLGLFLQIWQKRFDATFRFLFFQRDFFRSAFEQVHKSFGAETARSETKSRAKLKSAELLKRN